jgi:hypothetical protein
MLTCNPSLLTLTRARQGLLLPSLIYSFKEIASFTSEPLGPITRQEYDEELLLIAGSLNVEDF